MAKGVYTGFYDNTALLAATDADGEKPEVYFVCSRGRSAGKTYAFSKTLWTRYKETGEKFILLTRRIQDLQGGSVAAGIMKSYLDNEDPGVQLSERVGLRGAFNHIVAERWDADGEIHKEDVGYVIALAADSKIKNVSSMFVDAWAMFMDEFQPMHSSEYLKDEVQRLDTIHTSVARGGGQSVRWVPVFMCSNAINIFNPYFVACDLVKNIQSNTRLYKGHGYIYERCIVKGLNEQRKKSGFSRTFSTLENTIDNDNTWLADSGSCVAKPDGWGTAETLMTLVNGNEYYGVKYYPRVDLYYIDRKPQRSASVPEYSMTLGDNLNIPFLKKSPHMKVIRDRFMAGQVRCKDTGIQSAILDMFVA